MKSTPDTRQFGGIIALAMVAALYGYASSARLEVAEKSAFNMGGLELFSPFLLMIPWIVVLPFFRRIGASLAIVFCGVIGCFIAIDSMSTDMPALSSLSIAANGIVLAWNAIPILGSFALMRAITRLLKNSYPLS
jgi:hypothetical protein